MRSLSTVWGSAMRVTLTVSIFAIWGTLPLRAEVLEINTTREETLIVAKDMVVSLNFPYEVERVVHGDRVQVSSVKRSVFVQTDTIQSVFVMLEGGVNVPLLLVPLPTGPVSYTFRMPRPFHGEFYEEIAQLMAGMYHDQDVLSYKRDTTHLKVQVRVYSVGKDGKVRQKEIRGELVERYVGNFMGFVITGKGFAKYRENQYWEPGVVAVALDKRGNEERLYVVATRDVFKDRIIREDVNTGEDEE